MKFEHQNLLFLRICLQILTLYQICTTTVKIIILRIWLLKPCETLWYPVKISWAKINLQRISVTYKNLKSPLYSRFSIIFEKYGVWFSGLRISFLLLKLKNPRSRSRRVCSYFMKKSRFLHGLSTLQSVLIYDHGLRSYSLMTEKKDPCTKF